jgi:hypothetical protein
MLLDTCSTSEDLLQGGHIGIVELRSTKGGCPDLGDDDP